MKKIVKHKKIPFITKLRYLFIGKRPTERKTLPKIQEYLYLCFNSIYILCFTIYLVNVLIQKRFDFSIQKFSEVLMEWQQNIIARAFVTLFIMVLIINIILAIHIFYIIRKTEFNRWIGYLSILFSILLLSPFAIVFSYVAYEKNQIAFE